MSYLDLLLYFLQDDVEYFKWFWSDRSLAMTFEFDFPGMIELLLCEKCKDNVLEKILIVRF